MFKFQPISQELFQQLKKIEPSVDEDFLFYPVLVKLNDGRSFNKVCIVELDQYIETVGPSPEENDHATTVKIENVIKIEESPIRLPVRFANKLYQAGESGMGYCIFTVVFNDGQEKVYISGNRVDFISYPKGKGPKDIIDVIPHKGRDSDYEETPRHYWCIYSGIK